VLDALSELDENTFKKSIKGVVAEKRSLTDESIQLRTQIDKLSNQLSDSRFFSITETIVNGLSRLQDRKTYIDARLKKLDEMSDSVERVGIEGLRNVSELFGEAGQHDEERRKQIRDFIPHIIKRIEVLPLKAENRTVKAIIMIDLVDGTRRLCWMNKTKLRVNQILLLSVKNRKPIMKLSKSGMVLFSRKDQPAEWDQVLLLVDKKPMKNKEARLKLIKMMFEMRAGLPKYLRSKELAKWAKIDLETVFSYDWHGRDKWINPAKEQENHG
jgi:regulator of replication initiation timing